MAIHDMSEEFKELPEHLRTDRIFNDTWFVFPSSLSNRINRKLNRALGIHKLNKQKL